MKYFIKKLSILILTLFAISIVTFALFQVIPGDAAVSMLGTEASPEQVESLREEMGFNDPVVVRYFRWLSEFVSGDMGVSYTYSSGIDNQMTVRELLSDKLPVTITLALITMLIVVVVSIPVGVLGARIKSPKLSGAFGIFNQIIMAIPSFFLGIIVSLLFGLVLKWFTPGAYVGFDTNFGAFLGYMVFPAFALALPKIAMAVKFLKNSIAGEMSADYVRTAYAKGNSKKRTITKHVLRNSLIPVITCFGMVMSEIMAGSIVIEQVFSLPGMGRLLVSSISTRDYPVVQAIILYMVFVVMLVYFIADILYKVVDPRIE